MARLVFARSGTEWLRWLDPVVAALPGPLPDVLHLVAGPVAAEAVRDRLLAAAGGSAFLPDVHPLGGFLAELTLRHGPGLAILPDTAHACLAEDRIRSGAGRWPWLEGLLSRGPLGPDLAALHDRWVEASRPSLADAPRSAEVEDLLRALDRRVADLPGHRPLPFLLEGLRAALESPDASLERRLTRHALVVVHEIPDPSPLRLACLVGLLASWHRAGVTVLVFQPRGPAPDLLEVGAFFGGDAAHPVAARMRTLGATHRQRRRYLEDLVASGQAEPMVLAEGRLFALEPGVTLPSEPTDPAACLGEGTPVTDLPAGLVLQHAPDETAELSAIARSVKAALASGIPARSCGIALADLSARREALEAVLDDHGLPWEAAGRPLATAPPVRAVLRLLRLATSPPTAESLLGLLESDLVRAPPPLQPRRMRRRCRAAGVRAGPAASWAAPIEVLLQREAAATGRPDAYLDRHRVRLAQELSVATEVQEWIANLAADATPAEYRYRILETADRLRIPTRAGRLAEDEGHAEAAAADGLAAWGAFHRLLDALERAWSVVWPERRPARQLLDLLEAAVAETTWRPAGPSVDRIRVLSVSGLAGTCPDHLWLGGLVRGAFPPPGNDTFLLPRSVVARLAPLDPPTAARHLLSRILQEAAASGGPRVVLSWPATQDSQPAPPAPALADWLALPMVGGRVADRVQEPPPATQPVSRTELSRLAARDARWRAALGPDATGLAQRQAEAAASRTDPSAFGPWDGLLAHPPLLPNPLRVTVLESYLRCPARAMWELALKLSPLETWDPDLPSRDRGRLLHRVLERFLESMRPAGLEDLEGPALEAAASRLGRILAEEAEAIAMEGLGHPALLGYRTRAWSAGLGDGRPAGLLRAWLEAEAARGWSARPEALERGFRDHPLGVARLSGKVDRVDRTAGGDLVVIDYKTGVAPSARLLARGLVLQPVVYAEVMATRLGGARVAAAYERLGGDRGATFAGWYGDPPLVSILAGRARGLDRARGPALLAHAAAAAGRWARGVFHTTLAGRVDAGCRSCDCRRICRFDEGRNDAVAEAGGDLQRPVENAS
ncbi:MAG: PD-(D/E)XK nuclease family protein [Deltaproteobacteria bacterium]|nr:PD-(D/E)XK nuclease family protein [Deltaproteobacteria bacterium]